MAGWPVQLAYHEPCSLVGNDDWVHLTCTSANKEGVKHKPPPGSPVSIEHLSCLHCSLDLSNPFHTAIWAVAVVTFFGCCRLGETTLTVASAFDQKYHVHIVIVTAHRDGDPLCPVTALSNHLNVNSSVPLLSTLFASISTSGKPKNLLKNDFLKFVTGIWSSTMLAHILGHSFWIGGAVELLLAGVPPEIIAATGGWTSLAFLLYWCCMDEILPMCTSKAYNKACLDCLASMFEEFCISHKISFTVFDNFNFP